jgi:hypothetical protein
MVLPTISEKGFTIKDAVITRITRPEISIKFVEGHGIDISIRLPELEIRGEAGLDVLFITYQSQVIALSNDMHVNMRVAIHRRLNESSTNVTVSQCSVDPGSLKMNYYGADAGEFYTIGNMIKDGIEHAIRDKICMLPLLLREFIHEKIDLLMQPPKANEHFNSTPSDDDTVLDHLCGKVDEDKPSGLWDSPYEEDKSEPDVGVNEVGGAWLPDLVSPLKLV